MYGNPRTFRCPNCNEMINDQMSICRFCSVAIDPGIAELIADRQQKANQAYSDASFLRTTCIAMFVFLGLSFIPMVPLVYWGFLITFAMSVVLIIRWQIRFGSLLTNDPDHQKAKSSRNLAVLLVVIAFPVGFVIRPLVDLVLAQVM